MRTEDRLIHWQRATFGLFLSRGLPCKESSRGLESEIISVLYNSRKNGRGTRVLYERKTPNQLLPPTFALPRTAPIGSTSTAAATANRSRSRAIGAAVRGVHATVRRHPTSVRGSATTTSYSSRRRRATKVALETCRPCSSTGSREVLQTALDAVQFEDERVDSLFNNTSEGDGRTQGTKKNVP
jgi:hypothetical protein